jgi:PAS domain S-box-containing protein
MKKAPEKISSVEKDIGILAAIVQSSQDAIISKTLDGIVTSWNPGAEKVFGYTAEEMIGQSITKLIHPNDLYEESMIIGKIRRGERVEHMQTRRLHKDGHFIDVSLTISPVKDSSGNIIGASKIGLDITQEKKIQQALEESEQRSWLAIEAAKLGTFEWDLPLDQFTGSRRLIEIFGFEEEIKITHRDLTNALHPDDREARDREVEAAPKKGALNYEARVVHPDKTVHWIKVFGKVLYDQKKTPVKMYGTVIDITDQKLMEIRKNQFIAVASHELKTPLTSVKAYAQLLKSTYQESPDNFLRNGLQKVDNQVTKMIRLVSDLLDISKIETEKFPLHKSNFDLDELVQEVVSDMQVTVSSHKINIDIAGPLPVFADREKISQVLTNFLSNAVKYSPGQKEVLIKAEKQGEWIRVLVLDRGIGIRPAEQRKIFERFYRSKFNDNISFSGFGIGLYISAEIVRRHDGEIGVISEYNKGAEFYFSLPAIENV